MPIINTITPKPYKLGALPAVRPAALKDLDVYATGKLPTPPAKVAVPKAKYPIDCNDVEGDCTIAAIPHLKEAWHAKYNLQYTPPTELEIKTEYRKLSGGEDTGLVEADVLKTWQTEGLFGSKLIAYAPVQPTNILGIHQAVAFYDGAYLGIECPASAQEQFANGEPWTYTGSEVEGGHCIVALGFTQNGLLCATWGGIAEVTYGFCAHYLTEVWCLISGILVAQKKDSLGIDIASLKADLANV